mgnify:CR=1 FL=1|jgi:hypothetical protein
MKKRNVAIVRSSRPHSIESPFSGEEYTLLLCILDRKIDGDERSRISDEIIKSGCRYAVCWGHDCSLWDDSIDWSYLASNDFSDSSEGFVMTTWHEDDTIADTVDFWWHNTWFEDYVSNNLAIVFLGSDPAVEEEMEERALSLESKWNGDP